MGREESVLILACVIFVVKSQWTHYANNYEITFYLLRNETPNKKLNCIKVVGNILRFFFFVNSIILAQVEGCIVTVVTFATRLFEIILRY